MSQGISRKICLFAAILMMGSGLSGCAGDTPQAMVPHTPIFKKSPVSHDYDTAIMQYQEQYQANPSDLTALLGLARNLRYAGRPEQALEELKAARVTFNDHPALTTEIGKAYLAMGRVDVAQKFLVTSINNSRNNWEAYSALGIAYDFMGQYGDASDAYSQAAQICPDSASILNNMAISMALMGDIERSKALLIQASGMRPYSRRIKNNLSLIRRLPVMCPNCSREEYGQMVSGTVMGQDWSYGDLACTVGAEDIIDTLSNADFIDLKVEFEFDKAELLPEARVTLDTLGKAFTSEQLKHLDFDLEGHTDAVGTDEYNQGLSERRAQAVKDYLVTVVGIDASRLSAAGYGESRLLDPEHPTSGVNRRVRVVRVK